MRNEGVGIVLEPRVAAAWRESGEVWEAVSSRLVTARFKAVRAGQKKPGGSREKKDIFVSVISPTAKAPAGIQSSFRYELQGVLNRIPASFSFLVISMLVSARVH